MYHYVRPIKKSKYSEIKGLELSSFKRQIDYFKKNGNFISAHQLNDCIHENKELPKNSFLLTFDDGLKDNFQYVFPILEKNKIPGIFFPVVQPLYENIVLPVHKIHFILAKCTNHQLILDRVFNLINYYKDKFNLKSSNEYYNNFNISSRYDPKQTIFIKEMLQKILPEEPRKLIVNKLFEEIVNEDEEIFSKNLYLTINEIEQMKEADMTFGAHGYSHSWLTQLSHEQLKFEIKKSKEFCDKVGSNDLMIICYPYGDFNENVIKVTQDSGFNMGMTAEPKESIVNIKNSFLLPRFDTNDFPQ